MRAEGRKGWAGSKQIRNARTRPRLGAGAALLQREPLPHSGVRERGSPGPRAPTPHRAQHRGTRPTPTSMRPPHRAARGTRDSGRRGKGKGQVPEEDGGRSRSSEAGALPRGGSVVTRLAWPQGPRPKAPASPGDASAWEGDTRNKQQPKRAPRTVPVELAGPPWPRGPLAPWPPGPLALEGRASPQPGRAATAQNASARAAGPRAALLEPAEALADLPLARGKRFPSRQVARGLQPRYAGADLGFVSMTH